METLFGVGIREICELHRSAASTAGPSRNTSYRFSADGWNRLPACSDRQLADQNGKDTLLKRGPPAWEVPPRFPAGLVARQHGQVARDTNRCEIFRLAIVEWLCAGLGFSWWLLRRRDNRPNKRGSAMKTNSSVARKNNPLSASLQTLLVFISLFCFAPCPAPSIPALSRQIR